MPLRTLLFALAAVSVALAGCSAGGPSVPNGGPVRVVCTTTIIADAVTRVGGEFVTVDTLMGPGVDPHRYQPAGRDALRLEAAHVVFFNGLHLEGKMTDTFEQGQKANTIRAVAVTRTMNPDTELRRAEEGHDGPHDPHVWFDVKLWAKAVEVIRDELAALDPPHADAYRRNADAYLAELAALDADLRKAIDALPKEKRVLVTAHDAFGYFGRAYGFEVHGLQGVSTASETSTQDVLALSQLLGTRRVPAVFGETSVPPKGLKKVLDTVRQQYQWDVRLVGEESALYSDALGEPGSPGATYAGMVRHNVTTIVAALGK